MKGEATFIYYGDNYRTEFEYAGNPPEIRDQRIWIVGDNGHEVEIHHLLVFEKSQGAVFEAIKSEMEDERNWPLYQAGDDMSIWVITREHEAYDQYGEYFVCYFLKKPTANAILGAIECAAEEAAHIANGGGRRGNEERWYNLDEFMPEDG